MVYQSSRAGKRILLVILSTIILQLTGCSGCKMSGSPSSVAVVQVNSQCFVAASITCTCSGGGILSTCSDGTQTIALGSVAPGLTIPCPATFSCSSLPGCS